MADEVQAGHGRTGDHMWSFQGFGITPDFVTLGKPMGNGYPVAALITRADLMDRFAETTDFFSTFGGNPVAARAAIAVLDVIRDERLMENAAVVGEGLRERLRDVAARYPVLGDVRGRGLLIGVDVVDADGAPDEAAAGRIVDGLRQRGVLVGRTGPHSNVLKIRPPLVFADEHAVSWQTRWQPSSRSREHRLERIRRGVPAGVRLGRIAGGRRLAPGRAAADRPRAG